MAAAAAQGGRVRGERRGAGTRPPPPAAARPAAIAPRRPPSLRAAAGRRLSPGTDVPVSLLPLVPQTPLRLCPAIDPPLPSDTPKTPSLHISPFPLRPPRASVSPYISLSPQTPSLHISPCPLRHPTAAASAPGPSPWKRFPQPWATQRRQKNRAQPRLNLCIAAVTGPYFFGHECDTNGSL